MTQPTAYQYVKLGANLEYLRGLSSTSLMQTSSLVAFPHLMENLPGIRYSVVRVVEVLKSLLILLEEMHLDRSLQQAQPLRPMLQEMEQYLQNSPTPQAAYLLDHFAERLVEVAKFVAWAVKQELSQGAD